MIVWDGLIAWLAHGLVDTAWWQIVLFTLVTTHITIAAVTIFLHRAQGAPRTRPRARSPRTSSAPGCGSPPAW
jgi:hypothetical protein